MSPLSVQKAALVLEENKKLKEKTLQIKEAAQFCSRETKELEQLLSRNQHFIQSTNTDIRKTKKLQVSGGFRPTRCRCHIRLY